MSPNNPAPLTEREVEMLVSMRRALTELHQYLQPLRPEIRQAELVRAKDLLSAAILRVKA